MIEIQSKIKPGIKDKIIESIFSKIIPDFVTPNQITIFRFFSIPFVLYFLYIENYTVALPLFFVSAFSDAVDGAFARVRGLVTDWGKLYDPLADKLLIGGASVILVTKMISFNLALGIIVVELLLIANAYYRKKIKNKVVQANWIGKVKMILQSLGIGALIVYGMTQAPLFLTLGTQFLYVALVSAIISLVVYKSI